MRLNKKGYSLTELLLTMAVFSIVMVSIVALLRTSSVSYKNTNLDVTVQTDSQILLAQVQDAIIDCNTLTGSCDETNKTAQYVGSDKDGSFVLRWLDGTVYLDDQPISDHVSMFKIEGLNDSDNMCRVVATVNISTNGTDTGNSYDATNTVEVNFRNNVDGLEGRVLDLNNPTGGGGAEGEINRVVGRYEIVNIASEFDLDMSTVSMSGTGFRYIQEDEDSTTHALKAVSDSTSVTKYITTSTTANKSTSSSYTAKIVGKSTAGKDVTVNLSIKPVKMLKGSGVVEYPYATVNTGEGGGFYSYIGIQGISIPDMKKYYGKTVSYEFSYSGLDKSSPSFSAIDMQSMIDLPTLSTSIDNPLPNWNKLDQVGIGYDAYNPEVIAFVYGNCQKPNNHAVLDNKNVTVNVKVTYPSQDSTATMSESYRLYCAGSSMKNL